MLSTIWKNKKTPKQKHPSEELPSVTARVAHAPLLSLTLPSPITPQHTGSHQTRQKGRSVALTWGRGEKTPWHMRTTRRAPAIISAVTTRQLDQMAAASKAGVCVSTWGRQNFVDLEMKGRQTKAHQILAADDTSGGCIPLGASLKWFPVIQQIRTGKNTAQTSQVLAD